MLVRYYLFGIIIYRHLDKYDSEGICIRCNQQLVTCCVTGQHLHQNSDSLIPKTPIITSLV